MKTKLLVANEPESSWTGRITPTEIGELIGKVPITRLAEVFKAFDEQRSYYPDEVLAHQEKLIKEWLDKHKS